MCYWLLGNKYLFKELLNLFRAAVLYKTNNNNNNNVTSVAMVTVD